MSMLLFVLATASATTSKNVDPLTPALSGKLQCYQPDLQKKTCASLAGYTSNGDGSFNNKALVRLSASPLLVWSSDTTVFVKSGAVCGRTQKTTIEASQFSLTGQAVVGNQLTTLRDRVTTAFAPMLDREICTTYVPTKSGFTATVTVDGVADPKLTQQVIWVSTKDGFQVG
jgi:hypothetical protein